MSASALLGVVLTLGLVLGLLAVVVRLLRRFALGAGGGNGRLPLEVVQRLALGPKQGIAIVRVGERLRLPSRQAVAAMTLEQRAAAFRLDIDDLITGSEPAAKPSSRPAATAAAAAPKAGTPPRPVAEPATFAGRFAWPLDGRILSAFGPKPGGRYNDGVNIKAAAGTPVTASASSGV